MRIRVFLSVGPATLLVALFTPYSSRAGAVLLEDRRAISSSGFVNRSSDWFEIHDSWDVRITPWLPFATFDELVGGGGESWQVSEVSPTRFQGSGHAEVHVSGPNPDVDGYVYGDSGADLKSLFEVRFALFSPHEFQFSGWSEGFLSDNGFRLREVGGAPVPLSSTGSLKPGVYDFAAWSAVSGYAYKGEEFDATGSYSFSFTMVPDGGSAAALFGFSILVLATCRELRPIGSPRAISHRLAAHGCGRGAPSRLGSVVPR